jgi:hypothetical protein
LAGPGHAVGAIGGADSHDLRAGPVLVLGHKQLQAHAAFHLAVRLGAVGIDGDDASEVGADVTACDTVEAC